MLKSNLKYYIGIASIFFVSSLHVLFFDNNDKYDVYLFYNHKRYLTNILYDVSNLYTVSLLTFFLQKYNKRVFLPFFILSLIAWENYFVFYNQIGTLVSIPIYILIIIIANRKWIDK